MWSEISLSSLNVFNQVFNENRVIVMLKSAYIKTQLGIASQVYVIKVKVTVTKNRNLVSAQ